MVNDVNKFIMPNGDEIKIDGLYGKITNCLLEVPQRIKLELNDGTLTLKAGSQVIVPNGFEADGVTPKFDYVDIESDVIANTTYINEPIFIYYRNNGIEQAANNAQCSGTSSTVDYGYWYDTASNIINRVDSGEVTHSGVSFPLAIINASNGSWASIDQVFNGMGYIGSTVWVDKGVKGLIPNGRNEDGTLRNIEYETYTIATQTLGVETTGSFSLNIGPDGIVTGTSCFEAGQFYSTNGVITSFQPKQPFRAVDTSSLIECVVIIDSYVNGASGYNVYSNGYCEQWGGYGTAYAGYTTKTITFLKKFKDTNYYLVHSNSNNVNCYEGVTSTKTTNNFSVVNSTNYNSLASWKAGGYLAKGEY